MLDLKGNNIILVISGGIAAYKSLELIRLLSALVCYQIPSVLISYNIKWVVPAVGLK